jgi:hypothetical protein
VDSESGGRQGELDHLMAAGVLDNNFAAGLGGIYRVDPATIKAWGR